jgi:CBS domain-containing protein
VLLNGGVVAGLWYGFIGLFLWQAADTAYAQMQLTQGLQGHRVGDVMTRPAVAVPAGLSLAAFIDEFVFRERHNGYPVVDGGRPVGLITVQQVRDVPQPRWRETTVNDVMTRLDEPLQATDDLAVAVKRLTEAGVSQFPVVSQGQLIGVISFTDLALVLARLPLEQRGAA